MLFIDILKKQNLLTSVHSISCSFCLFIHRLGIRMAQEPFKDILEQRV